MSSKSNASHMTENMSHSNQAVLEEGHRPVPHKGEHYHCDRCGMELEITQECNCPDGDMVHFQCCGQDMHRA